MPLSHLTLTVASLPASTSFFITSLKPLGYQFVGRHEGYIGFGQKIGEPADFWITQQKPGFPAGAAHLAFPAPSKEAVGNFFTAAIKAGARMHGEPKLRDRESGYYSAAVVDSDGNSIEAVYRPGYSSCRSEVSGSGSSVISGSSRTSSSMRSYSPSRSETSYGSRTSRATTAVESEAPSATRHAPSSPGPSVAYADSQTQKSDNGNGNNQTAKTIVGSLIGAAAGAALAYAWSGSGDSQSQSPEPTPEAQPSPNEWVPAPSPDKEPQPRFQTIDPPRPGFARSVTSKSPGTIYDESEHTPSEKPRSVCAEDYGRSASDGSAFMSLKDLDAPLQAIEYAPSNTGKPRSSTGSIIDPSRAMDDDDKRSTYSSSTAKAPSKSGSHYSSAKPTRGSTHYSSARSDAPSSTSSFARTREDPEPSVASLSTYRSGAKSSAPEGSVASYRSSGSRAKSSAAPRDVPLPGGSVASYSSYRSGPKSSVSSAREVRLPESVVGVDVDTNVTPDDSISQIDVRHSASPRSHSHRSRHSHSHSRHSKAESKSSRGSSSRRSSTFDEPVRPDDSISQISFSSKSSSRSSQRTVKAGAGGGGSSRVSSRRSSQVV